MNWQDVPGWTCPQLLRYYDEVAARLQAGAIHVEVGVAYGKSLAYLALKADPGVQILGVDSWLVKMGRGNPDVWAKVERYADGEQAARCMIAGALAEATDHQVARIELCRGNSTDVARALDFEVDSVFLDGSHEYEAVRADILAWLPRVKRGGYLAGHDINDNYPGVGLAVREILGPTGAEIDVRPAVDNGWGGCWVWRKP